MSSSDSLPQAVCFDLGNTLIEFGPRQIAVQYAALKRTLHELFGHCDEERLREVRDRQIVAPYHNGYRENDLHEISAELLRELYDEEPADHHVETMVAVRRQSFVEVVEVDEEVRALLTRLAERHRLALLSNYPCGQSIREGLAKLGLTEFFEVIVISGEIGFVKPHPKPYELLLDGLGLNAEECVYIGDNWLADVQGAKGMGMGAILTTQHVPYETFHPKEGDHQPDGRIAHLGELEAMLLEGRQ